MIVKKEFDYLQAVILIYLLCLCCQIEGNGGNVIDNIPEYRNSRREPILTRAPPVTILGDPSISLTIPARKVCHKGSFDTKYNSCTYIDKDDEAVPIYKVSSKGDFLFFFLKDFPVQYKFYNTEEINTL